MSYQDIWTSYSARMERHSIRAPPGVVDPVRPYITWSAIHLNGLHVRQCFLKKNATTVFVCKPKQEVGSHLQFSICFVYTSEYPQKNITAACPQPSIDQKQPFFLTLFSLFYGTFVVLTYSVTFYRDCNHSLHSLHPFIKCIHSFMHCTNCSNNSSHLRVSVP